MLHKTAYVLIGPIAIAIMIFACARAINQTSGSGSNGSTTGVTVGDNFYSPANITVTSGSTVTWTWTGANQHTVTSGTPGGTGVGTLFNSPIQTTGTFVFTFTQTGTYPYFCLIHGAAMTGSVTVQ